MPDLEAIPYAALEVVEPEGASRVVRLTCSPFLIGRGAEAGNHLQLTDKRISRRAAAVVYADGAFRLEDRGQSHGLFVNGELVEAHPLRDGDVITFGSRSPVQLTFQAAPAREILPELLSRLEETPSLERGLRDLRPLSLLLEATALLQSHLPVEEILGAMLDRALSVTNADRGLLIEVPPVGDWRPLVARQRGGGRLPPDSVVPSQTALTQAFEHRRSVVEEDVDRSDAFLKEAVSVVGQRLRSVVALPLQSVAFLRATDRTVVSSPGELLGVLYLDSRQPGTFSRLERQILEALARESASVLENARLLQKERERQGMEQELAIARTIQQGLLPKRFQGYPGFQVVGTNHSCLAVGGDYFDLMELGPDRTAFVIADVCGKGLGAAMVAAMLQGTFSAMTLGQEPAQVFSHVNRFICTHSEVERHATLFFGTLNTDGGLEYINAGHLPALLIRNGTAEFVFPAESLPLGLIPEARFTGAVATLRPDDTLFLFTDGVNEAANPDGEQFGLERLKAAVTRSAGGSLEELQAAVLAAVDEFTAGAEQGDDITLLVLRYQGRPGDPGSGSDTQV